MYSFIKKPVNKDAEISAKISEIEEKYSVTIPDVLKDLYFQIDDGYIRPCYFHVDGDLFGVQALVPILGEKMNFERLVDSNLEDGYYPDNYYPVAYDAGGAIYFWEDGTGKVYFSSDPEYIYLISDSIEGFLDMLDDADHDF